MKLTVEEIIQILTDADRVFREPPEFCKNNHEGLCKFISRHYLVRDCFNSHATHQIMRTILKDKYNVEKYSFFGKYHDPFLKCDGMAYAQESIYRKAPTYRFIRANWVRRQIKLWKEA